MNKYELQGFIKEARVFGAQIPEPIYTDRVPFDEAHSLYKDYVHLKANEDKTPWSRAISTGAGVGAGIGLLSGLSTPGAAPKFILGSVGAILGGIGGATVKSVDDWAINLAKETEAADDFEAESKNKLMYELTMNDKKEQAHRYQIEERRHRQLLEALEKKAGALGIAAIGGLTLAPERKKTIAADGTKMKDTIKVPKPIM